MTTSSSLQHPNGGPSNHRTGFLAGLTETNLNKIYSYGEVAQFSPGEVVISEGDLDYFLYILVKGEAEVSFATSDGWIKAASLVSRSVFGKLTFFDHLPRSARVSATTTCTVIKISEESFQRLQRDDPNLALSFVLGICKVLSLRVRHMNEFVQTLAIRL